MPHSSACQSLHASCLYYKSRSSPLWLLQKSCKVEKRPRKEKNRIPTRDEKGVMNSDKKEFDDINHYRFVPQRSPPSPAESLAGRLLLNCRLCGRRRRTRRISEVPYQTKSRRKNASPFRHTWKKKVGL